MGEFIVESYFKTEKWIDGVIWKIQFLTRDFLTN